MNHISLGRIAKTVNHSANTKWVCDGWGLLYNSPVLLLAAKRPESRDEIGWGLIVAPVLRSACVCVESRSR